MKNISDQDICFFFTIHLEFNLGTRLITQIKSFYPKSDIICITDGTHYSEFQEFCKTNNVKYIQGERLKPRKFGGRWLERMLGSYLDCSNAKYLIKLDPDTILKRRFNYFPTEDLAGDYYYKSEVDIFIQGGCRFHTRKLCEEIYKSNILSNEKYKSEPRFAYQNFKIKVYNEKERCSILEDLICEDAIISDAAKELNFLIGKWNEVWSQAAGYCQESYKYAAIHPVKG